MSFKRGHDVKKSLNIGVFRTIKDPTFHDFEKLNDGIFLLIKKESIAVRGKYLIIRKKESRWFYGTFWKNEISSALKIFDNTANVDFSVFWGNVGQDVYEIMKYEK